MCCLLPSRALAQERQQIYIDSVRLGFPASMHEAGHKPGFWTPVYVDVTTGSERIARGELTVEASDSDDARNRFTVALPPLEPREQATVIAYTKPGSANDGIRIEIRIDGRPAASKVENNYASFVLGRQLYLTMGSPLPGLKRAIAPANETAGKEDDAAAIAENSLQQIAALNDVRLFPTRWYGYEGIDLAVLCTGNREFLTNLLNEREGRKEALAEWVRRGGRLIVSLGRNQDIVAQMPIVQAMLPVVVQGANSVSLLRGVSPWTDSRFGALENKAPQDKPDAPRASFEVAKLARQPGREAEILLSEPEGLPLVVRGAYGLGKVTVVAFDLDLPPFATWIEKAQNNLWKKLLSETAWPVAAGASEVQRQPRRRGPEAGDQDDLATELQKSLEDFADVPIISFGWVALFILAYIILVGPLDYLFLKKVVKRLELTWITFPTVVLGISVGAYFTAYWLKGSDQRINKVDLLDIDLHTQQIYGTTWFSIFSPRIQNYTIGLEPADSLTGASAVPVPPMNLSWMGRPEEGWGGIGRRGSTAGFFQRAYDYAPDATGLLRVPIQVWSTKSFIARWAAPLNPAKPAVHADLSRPPGSPQALSGTITNDLPFAIEDAFVFQIRGGSGKWYPLNTLVPGASRRLDNLFVGSAGEEMDAWLNRDNPAPAPMPTAGNAAAGRAKDSPTRALKRLLFYQYDRGNRRDNLYRFLDESWRLQSKDEIVLFGRIALVAGNAEEVGASPSTPSRLWVGALPGAGAPRPSLQGVMTQATFIRIFIPVSPAK